MNVPPPLARLVSCSRPCVAPSHCSVHRSGLFSLAGFPLIDAQLQTDCTAAMAPKKVSIKLPRRKKAAPTSPAAPPTPKALLFALVFRGREHPKPYIMTTMTQLNRPKATALMRRSEGSLPLPGRSASNAQSGQGSLWGPLRMTSLLSLPPCSRTF